MSEMHSTRPSCSAVIARINHVAAAQRWPRPSAIALLAFQVSCSPHIAGSLGIGASIYVIIGGGHGKDDIRRETT